MIATERLLPYAYTSHACAATAFRCDQQCPSTASARSRSWPSKPDDMARRRAVLGQSDRERREWFESEARR